jgi:hypothetical protein
LVLVVGPVLVVLVRRRDSVQVPLVVVDVVNAEKMDIWRAIVPMLVPAVVVEVC